jgi:hypothetical protein
MALSFRKPIQSSLSPRYKLMLLAYQKLTGKETESNAIRQIIEDKFDHLPLPDKIMYWRFLEKHFPDESKALKGVD